VTLPAGFSIGWFSRAELLKQIVLFVSRKDLSDFGIKDAELDECTKAVGHYNFGMLLARYKVADDTINRLIVQNVSVDNMGGISEQDLTEFGITDPSEQELCLSAFSNRH